jgi:hypothetical protein
MKKTIQVFASAVLLAGCANSPETTKPKMKTVQLQSSNELCATSASDGSSFLNYDTANRMIESYLTSINASDNGSDVHSYIVNVNDLRSYLNSDSGRTITHLKIMLAHTKAYVNGGGYGIPCGYNAKNLTVVLAGYNSHNNYVFYNDNQVMDYSSPCPACCPKNGSAASDLIEK